MFVCVCVYLCVPLRVYGFFSCPIPTLPECVTTSLFAVNGDDGNDDDMEKKKEQRKKGRGEDRKEGGGLCFLSISL